MYTHGAQMADSGASSSGAGREVSNKSRVSKKQVLKARRARKQVLKRLSKIVGQDCLYESVMLVLVAHGGRVQTFSSSPGWRAYLGCRQNVDKLLSKRDYNKLTDKQCAAKVAVYGDPPTPQHAFDALSANACENLLRVMQFSKLNIEDIPAHMRTLQGAHIHLGKYLDEDRRGKVDGNKFEGHDKKNGRFKAQVFKEHELCKMDAWKHGECPPGPEYITFEGLLQTSISKMTKPMKVAAIFVMLEWANPCKHLLHVHMYVCVHTYLQPFAHRYTYTCMQCCVCMYM